MNKKALLHTLDEKVSGLHLKLFGERAGLSTFLFHSIFRDEQELKLSHILPQERMTVGLFREFLDYFTVNGYRFVSPDEVRAGLPPGDHKYGLITFDDGYFNNTRITPILAEYKVPAVFFISTAYITEGKKFWSDALYHERKKQRWTDEAILQEIIRLKSRRIAEIEAYLDQQFGAACRQPIGDTDRPMNVEELRAFARQPYVFIGNHTHQHEVLTNLSDTETEEEFRRSQQLLEDITGQRPWFVSYPNGSFNDATIASAMRYGLEMGITTIAQKNPLPLQQQRNGQLLLDRFNPAAGPDGIAFHKFRSSFQLKTLLKKWLQ